MVHQRAEPVNSNGRRVGQIIDGWLTKTKMDEAKHMVTAGPGGQGPGWATDLEHLVRLGVLNGLGMRLYTTQGNRWEASIETLRERGGRLDRGENVQWFLARDFWTKFEKPSLNGRMF